MSDEPKIGFAYRSDGYFLPHKSSLTDGTIIYQQPTVPGIWFLEIKLGGLPSPHN